MSKLAFRTADNFLPLFFFLPPVVVLLPIISALDGGLLAEGDVGLDLEDAEDFETEGNKMEVGGDDPGDRVGDLLLKTTD